MRGEPASTARRGQQPVADVGVRRGAHARRPRPAAAAGRPRPPPRRRRTGSAPGRRRAPARATSTRTNSVRHATRAPPPRPDTPPPHPPPHHRRPPPAGAPPAQEPPTTAWPTGRPRRRGAVTRAAPSLAHAVTRSDGRRAAGRPGSRREGVGRGRLGACGRRSRSRCWRRWCGRWRRRARCRGRRTRARGVRVGAAALPGRVVAVRGPGRRPARGGDQRAVTAAGAGLLLVRDEAGALRGFFNTAGTAGTSCSPPAPAGAAAASAARTTTGCTGWAASAGHRFRTAAPRSTRPSSRWWPPASRSGTAGSSRSLHAPPLAEHLGNAGVVVDGYDAAAGARRPARLRGGGQLEAGGGELPGVLPLRPDPPGAVRGDPAGLRPRLPGARGRLLGRRPAGAGRARGDDVPDRPSSGAEPDAARVCSRATRADGPASWPLREAVECSWYFPPRYARGRVRPAYATDGVNRQDWSGLRVVSAATSGRQSSTCAGGLTPPAG